MAKFKQACFAHDLSKKFQIFTAVHNHLILVRSKGNDSSCRTSYSIKIIFRPLNKHVRTFIRQHLQPPKHNGQTNCQYVQSLLVHYILPRIIMFILCFISLILTRVKLYLHIPLTNLPSSCFLLHIKLGCSGETE